MQSFIDILGTCPEKLEYHEGTYKAHPFDFTLSLKRNFSSWIFPGAHCQGRVTLDHGKSVYDSWCTINMTQGHMTMTSCDLDPGP